MDVAQIAVPEIIVFLIGIVLILYFFKSIITVALLSRYRRDRLAHVVSLVTWRVFRIFLPRHGDPDTLDDQVNWFFPILMFVLGFAWFLMTLVGFTCLYWATASESNLFADVVASGSGLTTLGFYEPSQPQGQLIAVLEGLFGLFIIAFFITFIPGYQALVERRNSLIAWIYARTGSEATAPALIEWFYRAGEGTTLVGHWGAWEEWFRVVGQSHTYIPPLSYSRSAVAGQDWLTGFGVLLDTLALALAAFEPRPTGSADVALTIGTRGLRSMTEVILKLPKVGQVEDERAYLPSREVFDQAYTRLDAAGAPLKADREQAWHTFSAYRVQYGIALDLMARETLSRPPLWLK